MRHQQLFLLRQQIATWATCGGQNRHSIQHTSQKKPNYVTHDGRSRESITNNATSYITRYTVVYLSIEAVSKFSRILFNTSTTISTARTWSSSRERWRRRSFCGAIGGERAKERWRTRCICADVQKYRSAETQMRPHAVAIAKQLTTKTRVGQFMPKPHLTLSYRAQIDVLQFVRLSHSIQPSFDWRAIEESF